MRKKKRNLWNRFRKLKNGLVLMMKNIFQGRVKLKKRNKKLSKLWRY